MGWNRVRAGGHARPSRPACPSRVYRARRPGLAECGQRLVRACDERYGHGQASPIVWFRLTPGNELRQARRDQTAIKGRVAALTNPRCHRFVDGDAWMSPVVRVKATPSNPASLPPPPEEPS